MTNKTFKSLAQKRYRPVFISIFGFSLGLFGIIFGVFCEQMINYAVDKYMALRPNTMIFDGWSSPPFKLSVDVYLWNWTNPEDFFDESIKIKMEDVGPYRFTEVTNKQDFIWHSHNHSVSFRKKSVYFFDEEGSKGHLNDTIFTVNSLAMAASQLTRGWSTISRMMANTAINMYHKDIFTQVTADEIIFTGYKDPILKVAKVFPSLNNLTDFFTRFAYVYRRNNSADYFGNYNAHTGADDIRKLGQLHSFNYMKDTYYYPTECNEVVGSTGEIQTPYLEPNKDINYYAREFCRYISMEYVGQQTVQGITGNQYVGGLRSIDNGTLYPENKCFCNGDCMPSGVFNVSTCWFFVKLFISYPHFYLADPIYLREFEGLNPQKDIHESQVVVDARTGLPLNLSIKYQVNILVEQYSEISMLRKMKNRKVLMPLLWFRYHTVITPEFALKIKLLSIVIVASKTFAGICFFIGLILMTWHPGKYYFRKRFQPDILSRNFEIQALAQLNTTLRRSISVDEGEIVFLLSKDGNELETFKSTELEFN